MPDHNLLGVEGAHAALALERLSIAAAAVAAADASALGRTVSYVQQRREFGQVLADC